MKNYSAHEHIRIAKQKTAGTPGAPFTNMVLLSPQHG